MYMTWHNEFIDRFSVTDFLFEWSSDHASRSSSLWRSKQGSRTEVNCLRSSSICCSCRRMRRMTFPCGRLLQCWRCRPRWRWRYADTTWGGAGRRGPGMAARSTRNTRTVDRSSRRQASWPEGNRACTHWTSAILLRFYWVKANFSLIFVAAQSEH